MTTARITSWIERGTFCHVVTTSSCTSLLITVETQPLKITLGKVLGLVNLAWDLDVLVGAEEWKY